jgi:endonuclease/exonuclease/phosphatase family protein
MSLRQAFDPSHRGRPRLRGLLVALAVALISAVPAVPARAATTFVLLQMNLCNSGRATSCYAFGKAVDEAVVDIHRYRPQLVTVQEVCRDDVYAPHGWGKLAGAMADLYGGDRILVDFTPTRSRLTGDGYRGCLNGEEYGVAVIHRGDGREIHRGWYASQDGDVEMRAWTCAVVTTGRLTGCTTHLSIDPQVAMRQCRELVAVLASAWMTPQVVVSGDLNLSSAPGTPYDVHGCAPPGLHLRGDGAVQQVFFTGGIEWVQGRHEPMRWTDHPLLYERFRL